MKLLLDDIRKCPEDFDFWAQEASIAMAALMVGNITHISFDHDLGEELTGYDVAKFIEEKAAYGIRLYETWAIHSANPVGRKNIEMAMNSADKMLKEQGK